MQGDSPDPFQALALLPLNENTQIERQWMQDTLAWLKAAPPELGIERLSRLAEGICQDSGTKARFRHIWAQAFAPRLFAEVGLPEGTSLLRELVVRLKTRLLPQVEDDLDLY